METPLFSCPNCKKEPLKTDLDCRLEETDIVNKSLLTPAEKRKLRRLKRKAKV